MLASDSLWVSRMWEIHKSGLMRGEAAVDVRYTGIEAHTGKP